jgi:thioesterase DpgC
MTLPARKEGIIPAMATCGWRASSATASPARRSCTSAASTAIPRVGRMICDEVVDPAEIDATIERVIDRLTGSGAVGAIGNRRALRLLAEPFDTFRQYAALYAREQALCHFSPALISNLELFWNAQNRKRDFRASTVLGTSMPMHRL